jgi:tRNA nucleotidyltransferase/poly(A) polymerase
MDDSGKFYDYFGGLNDLLSKTLRFIGSASQRIIEDYLRILRALRFFNLYCEKGLEKNSENFDSIRKYSYKLNLISGERIASETIKIFEDSNQDKNLTNLEYFNSLNITQFVFLEDKKLTFSYLRNALDLKFLSNLSGIRKIGLVLKENSIDPLKIKKRWCISNKDYSILNKIFKFQFDIQDFFLKPKKYIYLNYEFIPEMLIIIFSKLKSEKIPINSFENFIECFEIQNLRNKELSEIFCNALNKKIEKPILPIDSKLLISLGFSGKEISNGFNEFEKIWLDKNCEEIQEINETLLKIKSSYN